MAKGAKEAIAANVRASRVAHPSGPATKRVVSGNATAARGGNGPVRRDALAHPEQRGTGVVVT